VVAAVSRFWRLGHPQALVFDEITVFMQAGAYIRGQPFFLSLHPPLAKLLIALSINLFGDHAYARRIPSALIGTTLVPTNYLLARRLFLSRFAAILAGALTVCEGIFLVSSRLGMINIFYVTFAAFAYLALFRFRQLANGAKRRRLILVIGIVLGCEFAAKAGISVVPAFLVFGVLLITIWKERVTGRKCEVAYKTVGTFAMVGGSCVAVYVAAFLPYYYYGWWTGIGDLIHYQRWVIAGNLALAPTGSYSSPVWSWPFMLRAFPYWSGSIHSGRAVTVWCGGNLMIWWTIPPALIIGSARAIKERNIVWAFAPLAYCLYMIVLLPVRRFLLIYDYMPMCEIGIVAIAGVLAVAWHGETRSWEQILLLAPAVAILICAMRPATGGAAAGGVMATWFVLARQKNQYAGRFVCIPVMVLTVALFLYFYPLWSAMALSHTGYLERMWFKGPGLANWM
jgi:dolichyl-phosphate-mannose-protein mannosyltransferase